MVREDLPANGRRERVLFPVWDYYQAQDHYRDLRRLYFYLMYQRYYRLTHQRYLCWYQCQMHRAWHRHQYQAECLMEPALRAVKLSQTRLSAFQA